MVPTVVSGLLGAVRLAPGVTVERMGEEFLALVGGRVVRVAGPAAVVLAAVQDRAAGSEAGPVAGDGDGVGAGELPAAVEVLVELGVLERTGVPGAGAGPAPVAVSRRQALGVAAAVAALGVTVLVLPQAAAAASGAEPAAGGSGTSGGSLDAAPDAPTNVSFSDAEETAFTVSWGEGA